MRKRTRSRELALQILYQLDLGEQPFDRVWEDFWEPRADLASTDGEKDALDLDKKDPEVRAYTRKLVEGVLSLYKSIDPVIERCADNWELRRMAFLDRNLLRLAAYEMLHVEEVPIKVSINEAVELAKRYGEEDSSKFVNGVLDKIAKTECKK
ncbi:MAG: hypothetical protein MOGMAGMI_01228 [Candidatus Omnitrophica bacterium]|nr:hypothetical protein [Candidatus Omnitrophota bacterium]